MQHAIYLKLALQSLKKNYRISIPFIGGSIIMTAMLYAIVSLAYNPGLGQSFGGGYIQMMMGFGYRIILLFVLIFMFYLNSVWIKNRTQENGLFAVLGLNKSHLIRIQFYQLVVIFFCSLVAGIPLGICLDKLIYLLVLKIAHLDPVFGFYFSWDGFRITTLWMGLCFAALFFWSIYATIRTNPLEKLQQGKSGERAIKNRWILALLGLVSLVIGYGMAITITNPMEALLLFFVAVFFVVVGTYLLFMYGTTVLVSLLQKNRRLYYSPAHFISISTLKYRLKQNAAALANIAILSTMVLVSLSTTLALVLTLDETNNQIYPRQYAMEAVIGLTPEDTSSKQSVINEVQAAVNNAGTTMTNPLSYLLSTYSYQYGNSDRPLYVVDVESINEIAGTSLNPGPGQVIVIGKATEPETLTLTDNTGTIEIVDSIDKLPEELRFLQQYPAAGTLAAGHLDTLPPMAQNVHLMFDTPDSVDHQEVIHNDLMNNGSNTSILTFGNTESLKQDVFGMYSGMLFIGVYLSALFILTVILILYYKQISEGIEDKGRFAIMKKIGLDSGQIKKVINDQVMLIFFLPLGVSLLHILFAFPMLTRILSGMNMANQNLFLIVMLACFVIFALIYLIIYKMTSRTYYKLVAFAPSSGRK